MLSTENVLAKDFWKGITLTEEDIQNGREILKGKISGDEAVKRILREMNTNPQKCDII